MSAELLRFLLVGGWPDGAPGGLLINLALFTAAFLIGLAIAVPLAVMRLAGPPPLRFAAAAFVELARATPLLLLVFWSLFLLPLAVGGYPNPLASALIGLAVHSAANQTEILRAGFAAVPAGEVEAGLAAGMSRFQTSIHIVIPQGVRRMVPAHFSFAVSLFKDTAVVYVVGVVDLLQAGLIAAERRPSEILTYYLAVAACFFLASFTITLAGRCIERRWSFARPVAA